MPIKHKWPGWFVLSVLLFCCADLKAVDKDGFADKKGDLPTELQKYTEISNGRITFTVKANEPIVSMELYYQGKFSFTAIQPSSTEKTCYVNFKYGECDGLVEWTRSNKQFSFHGGPVKAIENVKVDIDERQLILHGDGKAEYNVCGLQYQPSDAHGLFKKKVNISISAATCDLAFAFDATEFKLLATPPPPTHSPDAKKVPVVKESGGLQWWIIVFVAVGAIILCGVIICVIVFLVKRKSKHSKSLRRGEFDPSMVPSSSSKLESQVTAPMNEASTQVPTSDVFDSSKVNAAGTTVTPKKGIRRKPQDDGQYEMFGTLVKPKKALVMNQSGPSRQKSVTCKSKTYDMKTANSQKADLDKKSKKKSEAVKNIVSNKPMNDPKEQQSKKKAEAVKNIVSNKPMIDPKEQQSMKKEDEAASCNTSDYSSSLKGKK